MFSKYYLFLKEKNCICCQFRQHNTTHYAQDKTKQQIMHNTTHCAPADSILYTVNICFSDANCPLILPHHKNKTFHFNTRVPNFHSGKEIMILPSIIHLSFIWKTCYTHYPPHCNLFYSRYSKHSNIIICACSDSTVQYSKVYWQRSLSNILWASGGSMDPWFAARVSIQRAKQTSPRLEMFQTLNVRL